jgi:hypothetical protein
MKHDFDNMTKTELGAAINIRIPNMINSPVLGNLLYNTELDCYQGEIILGEVSIRLILELDDEITWVISPFAAFNTLTNKIAKIRYSIL